MFLVVLVCTIIAAIAYIAYKQYEEKVRSIVRENSQKLAALFALNRSTTFHCVKDRFTVFKHYDNKSNFSKVEPAYLMSADIREKMAFFSEYIRKIQENREKVKEYQASKEKIWIEEDSIDYSVLKISRETFKRYEAELFEKNTLKPVTDCVFTVTMSYSSPKGQVNLSKAASFGFRDICVSFESVSRTTLDKETFSQLKTVERGEVSDSLRYNILNRDKFTCVICGASSKQGARLHIDHIVPISKGGKSVPSNLRTLCERCNIGKSDKIETAPQQSVKQVPSDEVICQWCGAKMVSRKGQFGEFYGCSNYPKCKFTRKS